MNINNANNFTPDCRFERVYKNTSLSSKRCGRLDLDLSFTSLLFAVLYDII